MALQIFKIAEVTVASPQANIEFTSIPQGYADRMIFVSARSSLAQIYGGGSMIFNDDSTAGSYAATRRLYGTGTGVETGVYNTNQVPNF